MCLDLALCCLIADVIQFKVTSSMLTFHLILEKLPRILRVNERSEGMTLRERTKEINAIGRCPSEV